jgi:hypothetical protein
MVSPISFRIEEGDLRHADPQESQPPRRGPSRFVTDLFLGSLSILAKGKGQI